MWVGVCMLTTATLAEHWGMLYVDNYPTYLPYLLSSIGRTLGSVEQPPTGKVSPRNLKGTSEKKR